MHTDVLGDGKFTYRIKHGSNAQDVRDYCFDDGILTEHLVDSAQNIYFMSFGSIIEGYTR